MTFPRVPSRHRLRALLLSSVLLVVLGGCKYFSSIIIPAVDTQPPLAVASVYDVDAAEYVAVEVIDALQFRVTDPEKAYIALGATFDGGGAKYLRVQGMWIHYCGNGGGGGLVAGFAEPPVKRAPDRDVGDSTSNGLWSYVVVRFADGPASVCPNGRTPHHVGFRWFVSSLDFHDNFADNYGEMTYYPSGS